VPPDHAPRIVETADGREVGYRRFGSGPPAVLLHASPRSAAALLPLGERLADRFTVFAFDTPGFGWSEPLRIARPDAADFGDALIGAFDALDLDRAPVYGSHTGAAIAVAAANHHPDRIAALALDGYAMFTPAEQTQYAQFYLAPIRADWSGTHLAWLWSRVKDQFTVFPWHLMGQWARLPRALLDPPAMQNVVVDFLAAGDNYRAAYSAAFRFDGGSEIRALTVPTTVLARSDDLLFGDLDRLGKLPINVTVQKLGSDHCQWASAVASALQRGDGGTAPAIPAEAPRFRTTGLAQSVVRVPGGTIGIALGGRVDGRKLVLLPGIPGSARGEAALIRALGRHFAVCAIDLPGFGASHLAGHPDASAIANAVQYALRELDIDDFDAVAVGESASVACALAALAPRARLALLDPVPDAVRSELASHMTDVTPCRDGSHLLAAWHQLRDAKLWRPWYDGRPERALDCGTDPDVESLQATLTDWMRGGTACAATIAAALAPSLAVLIAPLGTRAAAILLPDHAWSKLTADFGKQTALSLVYASDDPGDRARAICNALAS
jgi:pimeloyl-ACP methyl ester carboxylesterase